MLWHLIERQLHKQNHLHFELRLQCLEQEDRQRDPQVDLHDFGSIVMIQQRCFQDTLAVILLMRITCQ